MTPIRTNMGRPLDFHYPSNRFVAIAAVLAGLVTLAWQWSRETGEIGFLPLQVALGLFLAWAIGRELDPDDSTSATLAAMVFLPLLGFGRPLLGASGALLIGIRVAARTTGLSPSWVDCAVLLAAAGYFGTQPATWPALGAFILAIGADRFAEPPGPARSLACSALMIFVAGVGAGLFAVRRSPWSPPTRVEWLVLGCTFAAAVYSILKTCPPASRGDLNDEVLSQSRIRLGRILVLGTLVLGVALVGGPTIRDLTPLWAAIIGVAVTDVAKRVGRWG